MSTQPGYQAPTVTVATALPKRRTSAAVLIVPVVAGDEGAPTVVAAPFLEPEWVEAIDVALAAVGAKGTAEQVSRLHVPALPVASVLAVGVGPARDEWPSESIRRAAGVAARCLNGVESVITTLSELHLEAAIEGLILGSYQMHAFRSPKTAPKEPALTAITALSTATGAKTRAARAVAVAEAVATTRDLVNTPPSHLHPEEFARRAKDLGTTAGLTVDVLDEKALAKAGYGGIIGVGQGSANPPRLVRLTYRGAKHAKGRKGSTPVVALIGKGITFDTGGISIKPAASMHHMTSDMAGAAAVIATIVLAARLQLPLDVIATVPMAENMPSATAQRPG
ncbi:MAG: leucyl aminopeptidase, partial [Mycobacterium sp.]|nr:leucyl aminopeptidase [Mycobacterium sp.]